VLLILDESATPFHRIWCDFELYSTLTDGKPLDTITILKTDDGLLDRKSAPLLLSQNPLPHETPHLKVKREQGFPMQLLLAGISVKLEKGSASVASDKEHILNSMAKKVKGSSEASSSASLEDALDIAVRRANGALNSFFAQAAWPRAVKQGIVRDFDPSNPGQLTLAEVMRMDDSRTTFALSLGHVLEVDDKEVECLASALPPNLLELDLSFEACKRITDAGVIALARWIPPGLTKLRLDFLGCEQLTDQSLEELSRNMPSGLLNLRLDFAKCHLISNSGVRALADNLPSKLQTCSATFKGTRCDRNFTGLKAFRAMRK